MGNILFVGQTNSNDGDVSDNHGDYDGWLVKVNPNTFDIIRSKTLGTANYEAAYNIYEIRGNLFVPVAIPKLHIQLPALRAWKI
jgi:hypothetical protein